MSPIFLIWITQTTYPWKSPLQCRFLREAVLPSKVTLAAKKISLHMLATHFLKWNRSHLTRGKRQCNSQKQIWGSRLHLWDEGLGSVGKWSNGVCPGLLGTTLTRSTTPARSVSPGVLSVAPRSAFTEVLSTEKSTVTREEALALDTQYTWDLFSHAIPNIQGLERKILLQVI